MIKKVNQKSKHVLRNTVFVQNAKIKSSIKSLVLSKMILFTINDIRTIAKFASKSSVKHSVYHPMSNYYLVSVFSLIL